jgi:hypothetical protein
MGTGTVVFNYAEFHNGQNPEKVAKLFIWKSDIKAETLSTAVLL